MAVDRATYIGGGDIAALAGLSPYRKPIDVYMDKMGLAEPVASEKLEWGRRVEHLIAQKYMKKYGWRVRKLPPPGTIIHPKYSWWGGSPDRLIVPMPAGLEIKMVGDRMIKYWGEAGTDAVPEYVYAQVVWYMPLLEFLREMPIEFFDIEAQMGNDVSKTYRIMRNPELEQALQEIAEKFWVDHVLAEMRPAPDASPSFSDYLKKVFPVGDQTWLEATPEDMETKAAWDEAEQRKNEAEEAIDLAKNKIRDRIGSALGIKAIARWSNIKGGKKINYQAVVEAISANPQWNAQVPGLLATIQSLIDENTVDTPGSRRLYPMRGKE